MVANNGGEGYCREMEGISAISMFTHTSANASLELGRKRDGDY